LIVAAAVVLAALAVAHLRVVVVPVAIAAILASVATPFVDRLQRHRIPRAASALMVVASGVGAAGAVALLVVRGVVDASDDLTASFDDGVVRIEEWLRTGPLGLETESLADLRAQAGDWIGGAAGGGVAGSALAGAIVVGELVAGLVLTIVLTFFFIKDGHTIWSWIRERTGGHAVIAEGGRRAAGALRRYMLGTSANAVIEGVLVAIFLAVLGVPLVLPLALLMALGAFVPFLGALLAGTVATVIALSSQGPEVAVVVAVGFVVLQNVEGDLLQPLVLGRAVRCHAVAVMLAVATGAVLWGILGAALAMPILLAGREVLRAAATAARDG
jgi:putative heme transporter